MPHHSLRKEHINIFFPMNLKLQPYKIKKYLCSPGFDEGSFALGARFAGILRLVLCGPAILSVYGELLVANYGQDFLDSARLPSGPKTRFLSLSSHHYEWN